LLADVPCSGLGTLRSNPDIRWFVKEADLPRFQNRQLRILSLAYSRLKSGGEVVYSTCSTEPEENEQVVEELLRVEPGAALVDEYFRTLPGDGLGDGFFAARIRRQ
jgi:16S rRNA C967 or C1407 C5-methylase (RsmB/RsmF family)